MKKSIDVVVYILWLFAALFFSVNCSHGTTKKAPAPIDTTLYSAFDRDMNEILEIMANPDQKLGKIKAIIKMKEEISSNPDYQNKTNNDLINQINGFGSRNNTSLADSLRFILSAATDPMYDQGLNKGKTLTMGSMTDFQLVQYLKLNIIYALPKQYWAFSAGFVEAFRETEIDDDTKVALAHLQTLLDWARG